VAVAYTDEGVDLRKNGVKTPIMVMSPEISDFNLLIEFNLEPEIYSKRIFTQFNHFLDKAGIDSYPIHLKIDTGMHRLGFSIDELGEISEELKKSHIRVSSVFSHLAASDEEIHDDFTWKQISSFQESCETLKKRLGYSFIRHILNTSGIERFPGKIIVNFRIACSEMRKY
jgi:alanine racemase